MMTHTENCNSRSGCCARHNHNFVSLLSRTISIIGLSTYASNYGSFFVACAFLSHHQNNHQRQHNYCYYHNQIIFLEKPITDTDTYSGTLYFSQRQYSKKDTIILLCSGMTNNDNDETPSNVSPCPPPQRLRKLLQDVSDDKSDILLLPCCYDGLTARLVARCGDFRATFMTGFGVSAANGYPDTQLVSYMEMQNAANTVAEALSSIALEYNREPLPCIADGDTGYGNAINVKRTVFGYARAGMAGIMIEDQVAPKRCGHVAGKSVVSFDDAVQRVKAACDARDEYEKLYGRGTGPLILARTDSLKVHGFDDAIQRCLAFREVAGCDMTFLEAPESIEQMKEYCRKVPGYKLANMLEQGSTPILPPNILQEMGYTMAAYPLTLLSASIKAMQESLDRIRQGIPTDDIIVSFVETKDAVGFSQYAEQEDIYKVD